MTNRTLFLVVAGAFMLAACHKDENPANPIGTPAPQPPAGQTSTSTGTVVSTGTAVSTGTVISTGTVTPPPGNAGFTVFSGELKSGGGAFLYPGGENQTLSFEDRSNPVTNASIRYVWNGQDVAGQHTFAGMDLMSAPELADYAAAVGKDLRGKSYTRVGFDVRGSLSANTVTKIEVADDGNPATPAPCLVLSANGQEDDSTPGGPSPCMNRGQLSGSWQRFSIPVTEQDLRAVKDFFKATFIYKTPSAPAGGGGTVFFDRIEYAP